VKENSIIFMTQ